MPHPVRSVLHALRTAWRWLRRLRRVLPLLAVSVFSCGLMAAASAATLSVDPRSATPLTITSLGDYAALSNRDPAAVIALFVPGPAGVASFSRSGTAYTWAVETGSYTTRGGPLGGDQVARTFVEGGGRDTLSHSDSLVFRAGRLYEILFRTRSNPSNPSRPLLATSSGSDRIQTSNETQLRVYLDNVMIANEFMNSDRWTLARVLITSDTVGVALDEEEMVFHPHSGSVSGSGPLRLGSPEFAGEVALLAVMEVSGPAVGVDHDGLWSTLGPYLTGSHPYASAQAALDHTSAGDTVSLAPGRYAQRAVVERTVTLLGSAHGLGSRFDGSAWPAGTAAVEVTGGTAWLERLVLHDAPTGVSIFGGGPSDTVRVLNCTLSGHGDGILTASGDSSLVIVRNNVLTAMTGTALLHDGAGTMLNRYNLFHGNTSDAVNTTGDLGLVQASPWFVQPLRQDFRLRPGSPALGNASDGGVIGALGVAPGQPSRFARPSWAGDRWGR